MSNETSEKSQRAERLALERIRLGLTQPEMAKAAGTPFRTYCAYEAGETEPRGSFFSAVAAVGVDVLYILTGGRDLEVERSLSADEAALINSYRSLYLPDQAVARRVIECLGKNDS